MLERGRGRCLHRGLLAAGIAGIGLLLLLGCKRGRTWDDTKRLVRESFPDVRQLPVSELAAWLADESRTPPVLLDAREPAEYAVSHLPGAVRVDPGDPLATVPDSLTKDRPIVVYCAVGYRSSAVAERLVAAGFTDVANLEGSIFEWANDGRPLVRGGDDETEVAASEVHPYDADWGRLLRPELRATVPPE